ncbi:MAG: glycosyltransferase [Muribaculum sp.]|nr:glycosyltransferase [Muribaculum sp.]
MNNKTLLIVCGTLESGGAERVISTLSLPFADEFLKVIIVTWRERPVFYKIDDRVELISLSKLASSDNEIKKLFSFRKFVKKLQPDIILSFLTPFNMRMIVSTFGINVPKIVAERDDPRFIPEWKIVGFVRNMLYHFTTGILCQTPSEQEYFKGILRKKTFVIYNPIFLDKRFIGSALCHHKNNKIVSVGRLHKQKNHKLLIEAFNEFLKDNPSFKLYIYGEGEERKNLEKYIEDLNLSDCVFLPGRKKEVIRELVDSKIFVMTSIHEGMPNALIEAMCIGLPCMSTPVSGAIDLIINQENGYIVDYDARDIASKMNELVNFPKKSLEISRRAVTLYESLDVKIISKIWISYLNKFIYEK